MENVISTPNNLFANILVIRNTVIFLTCRIKKAQCRSNPLKDTPIQSSFRADEPSRDVNKNCKLIQDEKFIVVTE